MSGGGNFFDWLVGAFMGLLAVVWGQTNHRIGKLEDCVKTKADEVELVRQRDNVRDLFRENGLIRDAMNKGFRELIDVIHASETRISEKLDSKQDKSR